MSAAITMTAATAKIIMTAGKTVMLKALSS
jgi:hypothetical protein